MPSIDTINVGGVDFDINPSPIPAMAAIETGSTATKKYAIGDYVILDANLYKITKAVAIGDTFKVGDNISASTSLGNEITQLNASLTEKIIAEVPANTTKTVNFDWSTKLKITFVLMSGKSILRIVSVPTVLFSQKGPDVYLPLGTTAPIITTQPEINYSEYTTIGKSGNVVGAFTSQPTNYTTLYNSKTGTVLDKTTASVGLEADLSMADGATINQLSSGFKVTNNTSGTLIIIA